MEESSSSIEKYKQQLSELIKSGEEAVAASKDNLKKMQDKMNSLPSEEKKSYAQQILAGMGSDATSGTKKKPLLQDIFAETTNELKKKYPGFGEFKVKDETDYAGGSNDTLTAIYKYLNSAGPVKKTPYMNIKVGKINNDTYSIPVKNASEKTTETPGISEEERALIIEKINNGKLWGLYDLTPAQKKDRAIILATVTKSGDSLYNVPEEFKDDPEIVLAAMQQYSSSFRYASERLRNDPAIVMAAVQRDAGALAYAGEDARKNRDIILAAVTKKGSALSYAAEELKGERDIVLAAIQQNGGALAYASPELRDDRDLALLAVQNYAGALENVSDRLKDDREIILTAVQKDWATLFYASERLRGQRTIVNAAMKKNVRAFRYASGKIRGDRKIALKAIQQDGTMLGYASEELRKDPEIVKAAVQQNPAALQHVLGDAENYRELAIAAVEQDATVKQYLSPEMLKDRDINIALVKQSGLALQYAPDEMKADRAVVEAAIRQNWRAFKYAAPEVRDIGLFNLVWEEKAKLTKKSQALNFLWLNLDLPAPPDPADGSIRIPLPEEYINNVRAAGERHPHADIHLWVDSRRLTENQLKYLHAVVEKDMPNVHVKDLMSIHEYATEELYSRTETQKERMGYGGVVWLQVDAAKILVSLQGDYDQRFFADLDHAHLDIESAKVQKMLHEHGMLIGSGSDYGRYLENQLWGFDRTREKFFREYNAKGLELSYKGQIAYNGLHSKVYNDIVNFDKIPEEKIILPIGSKGLAHAVQPGHEWSKNSGYKGRSSISADELKAIFNEKNGGKAAAAKRPAAKKKPTAAKPSAVAAAAAM